MFRLAITGCVVGLAGIAVGAAGWLIRPDPAYFAVDNEGRLTPITSVNQPIRTSAQLINWTVGALVDSLSINFQTYKAEMARAEQYFTKEGFNQYINAWVQSNNLDSVRTNRYVVEAVVSGVPVVIQEAVVGGRYVWRLRVPMVIGYYSGAGTRSQNVEVVVTVVRVSEAENPHGVAIHQIVM